MVEKQQGIKTVLSFGTKSVDPRILEDLLIGRDKNANFLFKSIEGIVNNGNNQQILIIGQRGMGKTHLLRILYDRSEKFSNDERLRIAYFSEDEYGISNFFDFLTRILNSFIKWEGQDISYLRLHLEELQNTSKPAQPDLIEKIIRDHLSDKPLLILAENFGDILESMGRAEQGRLRSWLYKNSNVNIIATSQTISADFEREDRPFFGFFHHYYLKPLTYEDSERFLIQLARLDGRADVIEHLKKKGKAQVRAIHELVKGNHRLLVTFYEFLKSDMLAKLSNNFIKTINDLKPYYESYIRYLPPQQQKILRFIALSRTPQHGTVISKNCFIDQKSLSKQLSELMKKKLIEAIPDQIDKRNKLYDINEPLLRISIEIGEHKEGITALFIDFLALYYDEDELRDKKIRYIDLLAHCGDTQEKRDFHYELQAIERALILKGPANEFESMFNRINVLVEQGNINGGFKELERVRESLDDDEYKLLLSYLYVVSAKYTKASGIFSTMNPEYLNARKLMPMWGYVLLRQALRTGSKKLIKESVIKFEMAEAVRDTQEDEFLYYNWGLASSELARLENDELLYESGIEKFMKALKSSDYRGYIYADLAECQIGLALLTSDQKTAESGLENFEKASKKGAEIVGLAFSWGGALSFCYDLFGSEIFDPSMFLDNFALLSDDTRSEIWKIFSRLENLYFFERLFPILLSDIKKNHSQLQHVAVDWINSLLSNNIGSSTKESVGYLRKAVRDMIPYIPELEVSLLYIDTFEKYIIEGDKNSIYELTKEQRIFFLEAILHEKM